MKKRLLCYDEDNPVGIDENGVLNPNAMGGGADAVISIPAHGANAFTQSGKFLLSGSYKKVYDKLIKGERANIVFVCVENGSLAGYYISTPYLTKVYAYDGAAILIYGMESIRVDGIYEYRIILNPDESVQVTLYCNEFK